MTEDINKIVIFGFSKPYQDVLVEEVRVVDRALVRCYTQARNKFFQNENDGRETKKDSSLCSE